VKTMKLNLITLSIFAGLASIGSAQGYFHDDFSSNSQLNYYGVDREAPQSVTTGTYFGKTAMNLHVWDDSAQTNSFYDFQGLQRYGDTGHTTGFQLPGVGTRLSMDIYLPSSWNGTTGGSNDKRGGDLWARYDDTTQPIGSDAYPTVGFYNEGDGAGLRIETFGTYSGITDSLPLSTGHVQLDGWNNLAMEFDGTSLKSYVNGTLVDIDSDPGWQNVTTLESGFVQGWRPLSWIGTTNNYDVTVTNFQAVPEPACFAVLGLGGLALIRRRRNKK
jgi:MYXO-CTERM domain-containing protein